MADKPTIAEFIREVKREDIQWYSLGQALGVSSDTLQDIKQSVGDGETCLTALYDHTQPSWSDVAYALSILGHSGLASNITDTHTISPAGKYHRLAIHYYTVFIIYRLQALC